MYVCTLHFELLWEGEQTNGERHTVLLSSYVVDMQKKMAELMDMVKKIESTQDNIMNNTGGPVCTILPSPPFFPLNLTSFQPEPKHLF